jgi:CRP-like cAMP-binding protein
VATNAVGNDVGAKEAVLFAPSQTTGRKSRDRHRLGKGKFGVPGLDRSLIAGLPLFSGAGKEELDFLLSRARSVRYPKDTAIFDQGAEAEAFYLLLDGHIRVVRLNPDGEQVVARYINAGELFGFAVALGRTTYPATAIAAIDCVALAWPNEAWGELTARVPQLASGTYRTIGQRLQETQDKVMQMSTEQVEQRVAHTLLRLVQQSGRKTADGIEIDFPITRQDIAEMTGTTLHTVSRLLSAWEEKGLVRGGRQRVIVVDAHGLVLIAEHRRKR